jgi:hypothetical protein
MVVTGAAAVVVVVVVVLAPPPPAPNPRPRATTIPTIHGHLFGFCGFGAGAGGAYGADMRVPLWVCLSMA